MTPQLNVCVVWQDEDLVEVDVRACNEDFSGRTKVYTTYDELSRFAEELSGFPRSSSDTTNFKAGELGAYAFVGLQFYCFDAIGHAALSATIQANVSGRSRASEKSQVQFELQCEPNQIDRFVSELSALVNARSGEASLLGIRPYTQNIAVNAPA